MTVTDTLEIQVTGCKATARQAFHHPVSSCHPGHHFCILRYMHNDRKPGESPLSPDPETLHTTDPQEHMSGPVSSTLKEIVEHGREKGGDTPAGERPGETEEEKTK